MLKFTSKKLLHFSLLFLYIFAFQNLDAQDTAENRKNTVHIKKQSDNSWSIKTVYEEDLISGETDYSPSINLTKNENSGFTSRFNGPIYAQCTTQACSPQRYSVNFDSCGNVLDISDGLLNYNPSVSSNHTPIPRTTLDRVTFYLNNSTIMEAVYDDIAGKDRKSNYILGNSVPTDNVGNDVAARIAAGEDPYKNLGGTRWALNPWGTNTLATLFIHMDMAREGIRSAGVSKDCPAWPRFPGKTPSAKEPVDLENMSAVDRIFNDINRQHSLTQRRIDNFKAEHVILNQMKESNCFDVVPDYREPHPSFLDFLHIASDQIPEEDKAYFAQIEDVNSKAELFSLLMGKNLSQNMLKLADELKIERENALKDGSFSESEKTNLYKKYMNFKASQRTSFIFDYLSKLDKNKFETISFDELNRQIENNSKALQDASGGKKEKGAGSENSYQPNPEEVEKELLRNKEVFNNAQKEWKEISSP